MTNTILKSLATLAFSGALCAQTTYYVDANNGADTNSGTLPSQALRSLTQATTLAAKGDTIAVLPGTYGVATSETFPVTLGGTAIDQAGVTMIAIEGPSKTFIDGGGTYSGIGMVRFREMAQGARITGFTFRNMADAFWSCGIRLGSSSTATTWQADGVEVDNCVFESTLSRAIVVFGVGSSAPALQTRNCRIHNNLLINMNPNRRCIDMYGDGNNAFYNNIVIHPSDTADRAAVYVNALVAALPGNAIVKNNIIIGGPVSSTNLSWGIEKGPVDVNFSGAGPAVIEYNNVFGCNVNYQNFTPHSSNMNVDPMLVDETNGDYRLKPTSPMVDAGTLDTPRGRHDPDYYPGVYGYKSTFNRIPDIGAYELHHNDMKIDATTPLTLGKTTKIDFTGTKAGIAGMFYGLDENPVPVNLSLGVVLVEPLGGILLEWPARTSNPGSLNVAVPNIASLEGIRVVFQGAYVSGGELQLSNVAHSYIRK